MGFRFDTVVLGYILTLPFLLLAADAIWGWSSKWFYRLVFWLLSLGYVFAFFVCTADLPYFHHFYTRITMAVTISTSTDSSNLLGGMILKEWRYLWPLVPFFLISWFFLVKHKRLLNSVLYKKDGASPGFALRWFSVFGLLLLMGIWGRLSFQSHLQAGTAYFSDYGIPNMLALSPVYTFGLSYVNSLDPAHEKAHFMGDGVAVRKVQEYLKIPAQQAFDSPIARQITFPAPDSLIPPTSYLKPPNVVFIIMESMSAQKMGRYGNAENLTPFMDSLATQGLSFDSVFTSGIHTFAGIYSTLFSQPVIKRQHPLMKIEPSAGIGSALKKHDYSTIYFTTHDKNFDNVGNFLTANGFDRIVSMDDYPKEKILSTLGVCDDYLYEHATGELDKLAGDGKPFFAAIMTGSDHGPYITPDYFKPKHKDAMLAVVEYVDWSLQKFFREASQKDWFENTLFVIVADHGSSVVKRYDLPLSYVHTPLIFYAPHLLGEPKSFNRLGS
ncbi:MAG: sulfatase-like hydrolase/transferase, partial [Bacteroidota bacterium]